MPKVKYSLLVGPEPDAVDMQVFEQESLGELDDAVHELCDEARNRAMLTIGFHPEPGPPFSVPDAFAVVVEVVESQPLSDSSVGELRCVFATERARANAARHLPASAREVRRCMMGAIEILVVCGDITRVQADGIVNASNTRLELGGGVSGAIRRAARDPVGLQAAMHAAAPIEPGGIAVTGSFGLPMTDRILHVATASGGEDVVSRAVTSALQLAERLSLDTIAMPALGAGTGGLAVPSSARIMRAAIATSATGAHPRRIVLVLHDAMAADVVAEIFQCRPGPASGFRPKSSEPGTKVPE